VRAPAPLALLLTLLACLPVAAQTRPQIPNSELSGRERDRFFDRFKQPGDLRNDPVIEWGEAAKPRPKKKRCKRRSKSRC
jgi:hypothetical protein